MADDQTDSRTEREIEGLWDDIAANAADLRGRRVRVTVLESATAVNGHAVLCSPAARNAGTPEEWAAKVADWRAMIATLNPGDAGPREKPDPFGDVLVEKYRKQGLKLEGY